MTYYDPDEIAAEILVETDRCLIILRGLPAAGKTTFAHRLVTVMRTHQTVTEMCRIPALRIGRDDVRNLLCLGQIPYKKCVGTRDQENDQEDAVTVVEETMIRAAFAAGVNYVVEDSTNLYQTSIERLAELAGDLGAMPTVITLDTHIEECVARDALRADSVGEDVIRRMATAPGWTVRWEWID
jgi:predicted kinase